MSDSHSKALTGARANSAEGRAPLPLWKKGLFAVALLLGLVGVAMTRGNDAAPGTQGDPNLGPGMAAAFNTGGGAQLSGTGPGLEAPEEESPLGPLFMKGGLSFAVAFAAGYALRTFLKLTIVVAGVVALAIFGLQKVGIVGEIDWTVAQGYWDSLTANVGKQFESFKTFLTGSLPSAGAGAVGMISGFRR